MKIVLAQYFLFALQARGETERVSQCIEMDYSLIMVLPYIPYST